MLTFRAANIAWLAKKGITLSSYYGLTHPSQPHYIAGISGDYYGLDNDNTVNIPANVSTVVDLLEDKGISWGHYMEDMPETGFQGDHFHNQQTGANMYERKHNPAISFESVTSNPDRLSLIKNFTLFYEDLDANSLPQWMFITPNMTNDGHDSSITTAGSFARRFLEPLLNDTRFMQNTLVLLTFDESENYVTPNNILGLLLGDAIPASLQATEDDHFYNHYSELATVEANWGLSTLGRWDVGANVFQVVADKTGDAVRAWGDSPPFWTMLFNAPYKGPLGTLLHAPWPAPDTTMVFAGRHVLDKVKQTWAGKDQDSPYKPVLENPDGLHPPDYD